MQLCNRLRFYVTYRFACANQRKYGLKQLIADAKRRTTLLEKQLKSYKDWIDTSRLQGAPKRPFKDYADVQQRENELANLELLIVKLTLDRHKTAVRVKWWTLISWLLQTGSLYGNAQPPVPIQSQSAESALDLNQLVDAYDSIKCSDKKTREKNGQFFSDKNCQPEEIEIFTIEDIPVQ